MILLKCVIAGSAVFVLIQVSFLFTLDLDHINVISGALFPNFKPFPH